MGNPNWTYFMPTYDPWNSDTSAEYQHIQSTYYSGSDPNITASVAANYPNETPTRYFVELPAEIDVSDLAGSRPISIYDVDTTTTLTRVTGSPGVNEYRVPASTSKWRNVIEINAAQAGDELGYDYYSELSVITQERANYVCNTLFTGNAEISGNPTFSGDPTFSGTSATFNAGIISNNDIYIDTSYGLVFNTTKYRLRRLNIGSWNMDTTNSVSIAHGVTFDDILLISVSIINDAGSTIYFCTQYGGGTADNVYITLDSTNINIIRATGGIFDSVAFDGTGNRGKILIIYEL